MQFTVRIVHGARDGLLNLEGAFFSFLLLSDTRSPAVGGDALVT